MTKFAFAILFLIFKVISNVQLVSVVEAPRKNADWWKHSVIYQIYPRSFKDSDNDGIGDLQGIISKLEHLKDAGVTAAWLSPIYKSPQIDQGYDISDFKDIDEDYGTLEDFNELVEKTHKLGIKIVMDFVPNHSSNQHEWFKKSEAGDPDYKDYYIWRDGKDDQTPPNNWVSLFKGPAWTYSNTRKQWYLNQFAKEQPDLNYRNPKLVEDMKDVLKFWLDKGVDGFRMDAVPYLVEDEKFEDEPVSGKPNVGPHDYDYLNHIYTSDHPGTLAMIYEFREFIDAYTKEKGGDTRVIMTEAYTNIANTMLYYGDDTRNGGHFTFNFQLITKLNKESNARDIVVAVKEWLAYMPLKYTANWVLGNHDQHRVATRFGPENVDGFNMLTAILPGVMITYNGEEIGQENGEVTYEQGKDPSACKENPANFDKISRDFERTPFHWDDSPNAGFTETGESWLPVSSKYKANNLKAQSDSNIPSHYQVYKQLVALRNVETLVNGKLKLEALSDTVLGCTRTLEGRDTYLYMFNVGDESVTINFSEVFSTIPPSINVVVSSSGSERKRGNVIDTTKVILEPHESIIATTASDVSSTTEGITVTEPSSTDAPSSTEKSDGGGTEVTISFVALLVTIFCIMIVN